MLDTETFFIATHVRVEKLVNANICLCIGLSKYFETPGRALPGLIYLFFCFFGSSLFETGVVLAHFSLSVKLTFRNPSLKSLCNVSEQFLVLCFKILVDG